MRSPALPFPRFALLAILPVVLLGTLGSRLRADPPASAAEGVKVTLFTAVAEKGDEESIPERLKPYRDQIIKIAKRFRLAATKQETVKPEGKVKIPLPEKLGEAHLSRDGKAMTLELLQEGKSIATIKVNKFPMVLSDAKLKVEGQQVVLILDKGHK